MNTVIKFYLNTLNDFTISINGKKIYTEYSGYFRNLSDLKEFLQNIKIISRKSYSRTPKGKIVSKKEDMDNHSYQWFIANISDTLNVFANSEETKVSNGLPWTIEFSKENINQ